MVIAGYSGIGKTYFATHTKDAQDFPCMPYKYYLPPKEADADFEACKADPSNLMREEWPGNYIKAISNELHQCRYLLIPSDTAVLRGLAELDIPYILCYPVTEAKPAYEKRFRKRGNTETFQDIFIGGWNRFMNVLQQDRKGIPLVLRENEYLTNKKDLLDRIIDEKECQITFELDKTLLKQLEKRLAFSGLFVEEYSRRLLIAIIKSPEWAKQIVYGSFPGTLCASENIPLQEIDDTAFQETPPSYKKMERYEAYYRRTGRWAHAIVVDEDKNIRDGYTTFLLAKKFGVSADIIMVPRQTKLTKLVCGRHVEEVDGTCRPITVKRYIWRYERKKEAVTPGDVLSVNTACGKALMQVEQIIYMEAEAAKQHKNVKRHKPACTNL